MKKIIILLFSLLPFFSFGQNDQYLLSSHILDINTGAPAKGVEIVLSKLNKDNTWKEVDHKKTDDHGRVKDFLSKSEKKNQNGIYKLTFKTTPYFDAMNVESFYPFIEVIFEIKENTHYHVPITLSPFGYSTYRGN